MAMELNTIKLVHGQRLRGLLLNPSVTLDEAQDLLRAAFQLRENVVGLYEPLHEIIFPLSLVLQAPSAFDKIYFLVLRESGIQHQDFEATAREESKRTPGRDRLRRQQSGDSSASEASVPDHSDRDQEDEDEDEDEEEKELGLTDNEDLNSTQQQLDELEQLRNKLGFHTLRASDVFAVFRANARGRHLDVGTFAQAVRQLLPALKVSDKRHEAEVVSALKRLFTLFDHNGDGRVDMREFCTGLSVLCTGDRDEKIQLAFNIYDLDGDGAISYQEMAAYMIAFFTACFDMSPSMRDSFGGVTAQDIGRATADKCFAECDIDRDGKLTYDEFREWYTQTTGEEADEAGEDDGRGATTDGEYSDAPSAKLDFSLSEDVSYSSLASGSARVAPAPHTGPASDSELDVSAASQDLHRRMSALMQRAARPAWHDAPRLSGWSSRDDTASEGGDTTSDVERQMRLEAYKQVARADDSAVTARSLEALGVRPSTRRGRS